VVSKRRGATLKKEVPIGTPSPERERRSGNSNEGKRGEDLRCLESPGKEQKKKKKDRKELLERKKKRVLLCVMKRNTFILR